MEALPKYRNNVDYIAWATERRSALNVNLYQDSKLATRDTGLLETIVNRDGRKVTVPISDTTKGQIQDHIDTIETYSLGIRMAKQSNLYGERKFPTIREFFPEL